jgi:hypothetical protein
MNGECNTKNCISAELSTDEISSQETSLAIQNGMLDGELGSPLNGESPKPRWALSAEITAGCAIRPQTKPGQRVREAVRGALNSL